MEDELRAVVSVQVPVDQGVLFVFVALFCLTSFSPAALLAKEPPLQPAPISVSVDIRPGLCPNHLRIESPLEIPIAITGRADFDIRQIDPTSIRLSRDGFAETLEPVSWAYADVGTPMIGGLCSCNRLRGDGIDDLEFRFRIGDIVTAFDLAGSGGETIKLTLTGNLTTREEIGGSDCAVVISGMWKAEDLGDEIFFLTSPESEPTRGPFRFTYQTTVSDRVTLTIHDIGGKVVAVLNDMDMAPGIYTAAWDGLAQGKEEAPAGIYFARLSNSLTSDIMKITLSR
jgi:hypothetical protein